MPMVRMLRLSAGRRSAISLRLFSMTGIPRMIHLKMRRSLRLQMKFRSMDLTRFRVGMVKIGTGSNLLRGIRIVSKVSGRGT